MNMRITNFNPAILLNAKKLTEGRNPFTDVYLLSNNRVLKLLKENNPYNYSEMIAKRAFYRMFCAKIDAVDHLRDIASLTLPDEVTKENDGVKGFSYSFNTVKEATSFLEKNNEVNDIAEFYCRLLDELEILHGRDIVVPDLINNDNILYDHNSKEVYFIDYDGMQIGDIPTNVISSKLYYRKNPIIRSAKYSNRNNLYKKSLDDLSVLVDFLFQVTGVNIASLEPFQRLYFDKLDQYELNKDKRKIKDLFSDLKISDSEVIDGYTALFSEDLTNPKPKRLIKKIAELKSS